MNKRIFIALICFLLTIRVDSISSDSQPLPHVIPSPLDLAPVPSESPLAPGPTILDSSKTIPTKILVFGGNGFLGSATVLKLLNLPRGASITLVNRGNSYWDFETKVKPYVKTFVCDRNRPLQGCTKLVDLIREPYTYFDFVIDFSATQTRFIADALDLLKRTYVGLYIYISSDSVYEVVVKDGPTRMSVEEDAVRPVDEALRAELAAGDSYGDRKLECEEALARGRAAGGPPYVALRIPDVIGPRDNTHRFWMTHILLNLHTFLMKPLHIPTDDFKMSFVYVEDVASLIFNIANENQISAYDEAFNVAWAETFSLKDLYTAIASFLPIGKPFSISHDQEERKTYFYPSVAQGPVDVRKGMKKLKWNQTPWLKAVGTTVQFYKDAATKFPRQFRDALIGLNGIMDKKTLQQAAAGVYTVELSAGGCIDLHPNCGRWAAAGECNKNPNWMKPNCMQSCDTCHILEMAMSQRDKRNKDEL